MVEDIDRMIEDNWLSKNIRPLVMIYLLTMFTITFFIDVEGKDKLLEMLDGMNTIVICFYFGARGLEKIAAILTAKK